MGKKHISDIKQFEINSRRKKTENTQGRYKIKILLH